MNASPAIAIVIHALLQMSAKLARIQTLSLTQSGVSVKQDTDIIQMDTAGSARMNAYHVIQTIYALLVRTLTPLQIFSILAHAMKGIINQESIA